MITWGDVVLNGSDSWLFYAEFFFQWALAAIPGTIFKGLMTERTSFYAYPATAFLLTFSICPLVTNWVWYGGFLFPWGMFDFAGSATLHMVGGVAGLIGAIMVVGPRLGRFVDGKTVPMPGQSASLATRGTFFLWFGWYGLKLGNSLSITEKSYKLVEASAVNTTLAAAAGGATTLVVLKITINIFDLVAVLNGV